MVEPIESQCLACGGKLAMAIDAVRDANGGDIFSIAVCEQCRLGNTVPVPQDIGRYYTEEYYGNRHGFTQQICNRRRLRWINQQFDGAQSRRLLDIGCGDGSFLQFARQNRWDVAGVERSPDSAKSLGLEVFETIEAVNNKFDCVTLWHVLEHIAEIPQTLAAIDRVLADGGWIYLAVPDFRSFQARMFGRHWLHLDVPRHLFHFSEQSLVKLFAQHGFILERLRTSELEYDVMGWVQSSLNALGGRPNLLLKILMRRRLELSWIGRSIQLAAGAALSSLAVVPTWLSGCVGSGGTIVAKLQRRNIR